MAFLLVRVAQRQAAGEPAVGAQDSNTAPASKLKMTLGKMTLGMPNASTISTAPTTSEITDSSPLEESPTHARR